MTQKEAELILIEGLLHTRNSRPEFYKNAAKENGYSLKVFFKELLDAYERIEKYVNVTDYSQYGCDENGENISYFKQSIDLFTFTNGKFTGQIDSENVYELAIGLEPIAKEVFGKIARDEVEKFEKEMLAKIEKREKEMESLPARLQTNLKSDQRGQLFTELVNGGFIPDENRDCFNWAIGVTYETEPKQPGQWQPIEWKKSKWLLAYFVDIFNCEILGNDGFNKRTRWKPFELLFGETGLRGSKNDYQKTGSLPDGHKQIVGIIKSLK